MHRIAVMTTKTVRKTFHSIGDHTGDFARSVGSGTADLARRFGSGTADLAKRVGPRRGIIGLVVLGVAIGGSIVLIRYLRARNARAEIGPDDVATSAERGAGSHSRAHAAQRNDRFAPH